MSQKRKSSPKKKIQAKAPKKGKRSPFWAYALLFGLTFVLFGNTINHGWTLDDASAIEDNFLTQQGVKAIPEMMNTSYRHGYWSGRGHHYRPGPLVMFALEWEISPNNPGIHHFMNVLCMGLLILLIFYFLQLITGSTTWSLVIALLYLAHPLHVEVVANVKSRDEIMAMLLMLLSMIGWWRFNLTKSWPALIGGLLAFGVALLFKENSITLFGVVILVSLLFFPKKIKSHGAFAALYLIPALLYLGKRAAVLNIGNLEGGVSNTSALDNLLFAIDSSAGQLATALLICGKYFMNLFYPLELCSDYGFDEIQATSFTDWRVWLVLLTIGALLYLFVKYAKKAPVFAFGLGFFGITFSIYANLFVKIGSSYGDRFLFIPSLGFLIALVYGLQLIFKNWGEFKEWKNWKTYLVPGLAGCLLLFFAYAATTIKRNSDWKDSYTLYKADIEKSPNSAKLNYHYGLECAKMARDSKSNAVKKEKSELAAKHFERALQIFPKYADAYSEMGLLFFRSGQPDRAMEMYEQALAIKKNKATTYSNMGIIYFNRGDLTKAEEVYKQAIILDPRFVDAYRNLGSVYARQGRFQEAITQFKKGLEYEPNSALLNKYLGSAYKDAGQAELGAPYLQRAQQLGGQ